MITLLLYLIVAMIIIALAWWLCDYLPVPQPINRWVKIVIVVIAAFVLINALLNIGGINTGIPVR